jgi:hypothetical protein
MSVIVGVEGEVDQYVSEYFSVAKFRAVYAINIPTLLGKDQWMKVDPGFKLYSLVLTRPAGRPRKNRIRASAEVVHRFNDVSANVVEPWTHC